VDSKPFIILVVVLLVVAALFAVGVVFSTRSDHGAGFNVLPPNATDKDAWRKRFFSPGKVTLDEVSGCPKADGSLRVTGDCTLVVAATKLGSRDLVLSSDQGSKLSFVPKSGPPLTMNVDLDAGKEAKFSVPAEGATVEVVCASSTQPCRVALGR
jgi:hypothetical protein